MPRILAVLIIVVAFATTAQATELELSVEEFDFSRWEGKVVVVDFWASWCSPCREALPWLSATQERYEDEGLVTVAVNVDQNPKAPDKMIAKLDDGIIVVRDPKGVLARRHKIEGLPTAFVIGRDGAIRSTHVGFHRGEISGREKELIQLLAENAVTDESES